MTITCCVALLIAAGAAQPASATGRARHADQPDVASGPRADGSPIGGNLTIGNLAIGNLAIANVALGTYTGLGFDACSAPSSAAMNAWLASPYRAVGIYFGGVNRACAQPNLTPAWVTEQVEDGWHLMPIYLGLQAPCTTSNKKYRIDPAQATAQGRANAEDAVAAAKALGLPRESALINDMEAYRTDDPACRTAVLKYISAWTSRLHDLGYLSGFYGSMTSGVADQVAVYNTTTYGHPDYLDFARWDGVASTSNPAIPSSYWSPHRRIHQYRGGHNETYGGVTINIDNDYIDIAPLPRPGFNDFTGNGWSDLLARQTSSGYLYLHPGNGTKLEPRIFLSSGWNSMNSITRFGDFNRDGREDVIARQASNGDLWLYIGTGSGFSGRIRIGTSWNIMREITPIGDLNRDGLPDLVAVQTNNGVLYYYRGIKTGFMLRIALGSGWNAMDELTGVGDFNKDGFNDLLARQKSTGYLYLYPGKLGGFGTRKYLGSGWNSMRDLVGVGDFNRDGYPDLMAIQKSTNTLYLYPGRGTGFGSRIALGSEWSGRTPLL